MNSFARTREKIFTRSRENLFPCSCRTMLWRTPVFLQKRRLALALLYPLTGSHKKILSKKKLISCSLPIFVHWICLRGERSGECVSHASNQFLIFWISVWIEKWEQRLTCQQRKCQQPLTLYISDFKLKYKGLVVVGIWWSWQMDYLCIPWLREFASLTSDDNPSVRALVFWV